MFTVFKVEQISLYRKDGKEQQCLLKMQWATTTFAGWCDIIAVKCCFPSTLMSPQECHHFLTPRGSSLPLSPFNTNKWRSTILLRIDNIMLRNGKWMLLCEGYQWIALSAVPSHPFATLAVKHSLCSCVCLSKAALYKKRSCSVKRFLLILLLFFSFMLTCNVITLWVSKIPLFKTENKSL